MLNKLHIKNFRGFEDHEMPFRPITVAVGRNNAGKSTFIEALRIISIVTNRYRNLSYKVPPDWLDIPRRFFGASIDLTNLQIDFDTLCYEYRDPPAEIEATFRDGKAVRVFLAEERKIHAVLLDDEGGAIRSRSEAWRLSLPQVSILPQVTPLARDEKLLSREYILGAVDSHLASSHFRNQLFHFKDSVPEFRRLAEETWPGLQIRDLACSNGFPGDPLSLDVRNEEFVGEVGKMGHGLQMWLQCLWFLVRGRNASTLILDEPDVYMHADLQRRLMRYLKGLKRQVIIATHSVEIVSEVEPQDIMVIERKRSKSRFTDSIPAVQKVIERVGSTQNIHLARLWNAKRFIIAEGHDLRILKHFHDKLYPDSSISLEAVPSMSIGGWGGWGWAIGSSLGMKNAFGESVQCYCIFDRDYHQAQEILVRYEEAKKRKVYLHVWSKKELENFLLEPSVVVRLLTKRCSRSEITPKDILEILISLADDLKDEILDGVAEGLCHLDRKLRAGGANKQARKICESMRSQERGLIDFVSGKRLMGRLSEWCQKELGMTVSPVRLVREFRESEIDDEVKAVIGAIEELRPFPERK
jgi:hypothetical protein